MFKPSLMLMTLCVVMMTVDAAAEPFTLPPAQGGVIAFCETSNNCVELERSDTHNVSADVRFVDGTNQVDIAGFASGTAGHLRARAEAWQTSFTGAFDQLDSIAYFGDIVTVAPCVSVVNGVVIYCLGGGYIEPIYTVTGRTIGGAGSSFTNLFQREGDSLQRATRICGININGECLGYEDPISFGPYAINFGESYFLGANLHATVFSTLDLHNLAAFDESAVLTGLKVYDANMNLIDNPIFTSALGVEYSVNGVVPEPSTLYLLGAGLGILARKRRHE